MLNARELSSIVKIFAGPILRLLPGQKTFDDSWRWLISSVAYYMLSPDQHIAACPKCRSKDVSAEPVGIEFTKMTCNTCGETDVADVWARAEWYAAASKVCSICRAIPRDGNWPVDSTLAKFGFIRETYGSETAYAPCPECGTTYWYSYAEWLKDWQSETSFAFTRLDLAQTLESLPLGDRDAFREKIPALVVDLDLDLFSDDTFIKTEAAWKLARYYNAEKNWEKLGRLLAHADENIFGEAFLQSFLKRGEDDDPEPPPMFVANMVPMSLASAALARGIKSKNKRIKEIATSLTLQAAAKSRDLNAIVQALESPDSEVARNAIWYLTYKAEKLSIPPLRKLLIRLVESGNDYQATCALMLLLRGRKAANPVPPFQFIVDCLKHKSAAVRTEAASRLFYWANSKAEKQRALKILVGLLKDKTCNYIAMEALKNQAEFGEKEIASIIPDIIAHVIKKKYRWEDGFQVLRYAIECKINISGIYPFIGKAIAAGDLRVIQASHTIVDHIIDRGIDVSALRLDLEKGLKKIHPDYYGEQLLKLLIGIYLRKRDWLALRRVCAHSNTTVSLFATAALREAIDDLQKGTPEYAKALEIQKLSEKEVLL